MKQSHEQPDLYPSNEMQEKNSFACSFMTQFSSNESFSKQNGGHFNSFIFDTRSINDGLDFTTDFNEFNDSFYDTTPVLQKEIERPKNPFHKNLLNQQQGA